MKKTFVLFALLAGLAGATFAEDVKPSLGATISGNFVFDYDFNKDLLDGKDSDFDKINWDTATISWAQKTNDFLKSYVEVNLIPTVTTDITTKEDSGGKVTSVSASSSIDLVKQAWFEWNLFNVIRLQGGKAPEAYGLAKYATNSYLIGATMDLFLVEATLQVGNDNLIQGDNDTFVIPQVKAKLFGDFLQAGLSTKVDLETTIATAKNGPDSLIGKERNVEVDINAFGTMNFFNFITAKAEVYALDALNPDSLELVGYGEASIDLVALIPGASIVVYNLLDNPEAWYSGNSDLDADIEATLGLRMAPGLVITGGLGLTDVLTAQNYKEEWYAYARVNWTPSVSF